MRYLALALVTGLTGTGATAQPVLGTWLTPPDRKGQVAHVRVSRCDAALCGKIVRAFDSAGNPITTPNVGKRVFWNMTPSGPQTYEGRAWVPAHDRQYDARLNLNEDRLKVSGCLGPFCQGQVWTRIASADGG